MKQSLTHASLFSGIGGAELAASWMGWQNLFHCEINEFCRTVLNYWFPNSVSYEDIKKTDFTQWRGRVDVLTGGFPCQPFSLAGRRTGAADDRYLWPHMLRSIREIQPTWVVGENVAGLLSMVQPGTLVEVGGSSTLFEESYRTREEHQFTLEVIHQNLENEGYSVQPLLIPACAVGAPHRRDRVWIVAHRTDARAESLQQGGQNGIPKSSIAANTDSNRQRDRTHKQIIEQKCNRATNIGKMCEDATSPDTQCIGGNEVDYKVQCKQSNGERTDGNGMFRTSFNTNDKNQFGRADYSQSWWRNFPTQSPVCNRNDGLSAGLADITFPKWRSKSIEALGNAWLPQVAYEIFKVIENLDLE